MTEELPASKAAVPANAVLGAPMASDSKVLAIDRHGNESVRIVPAESGPDRPCATRAGAR